MTKADPIATLVDRLIAAPKEFAGFPDWKRSETDPKEMRTVLPLLIGGVSCGASVNVLSYPTVKPVKFRIILVYEKCIWRLDYVSGEPHYNSFNRPHDLLEYSFDEPHYHSWADNSRFCTVFSLPERLENARILPVGIRSFDSSFRWFCGEVNISQPSNGWIDLPARTTLL